MGFNPQIIHRDLKSLNLLLAARVSTSIDVPLVKVADFGFARFMEADTEWEKMTQSVGTRHWQAPEISSGVYDERVDVYSFAMVLFEIVCRQVPFHSVPPEMVPQIVAYGTRPDLSLVPLACPKELVNLMKVCWSPDASERPSFTKICETLVATSATCAATAL